MLYVFLTRLKLIQNFELELSLSKADFENKLLEVIIQKDLPFFEEFSNKLFVGKINADNITIRPIKKMQGSTMAPSTQWTITTESIENNKIIIYAKNPYSKNSLFTQIFFYLFLAIMISAFAFVTGAKLNSTILLISFLTLFLILISYFFARLTINASKDYCLNELSKLERR